jgi:hypothetical protein
MKDNGGSAFASIEYDQNEGHWEGRYPIHEQHPGMSLRDYFAGQATIGMTELVSWTESMSGTHHLWDPKDIAKRAYRIADAMIAEREKQP